MLHFPSTGIDLVKLHGSIKSTTTESGGIDYYQWGINTRIIHRDNIAASERLVDIESSTDSNFDFDMFWSGYLYGIEQVIEKCAA